MCLEYNPSHVSKSVYLRFKLTKKSAKLKEKIAEISDSYNSDKSVYGLIWTTTPWSLVANQETNLVYGVSIILCPIFIREHESRFFLT